MSPQPPGYHQHQYDQLAPFSRVPTGVGVGSGRISYVGVVRAARDAPTGADGENPMVPDGYDSHLAPCPRCRHSDSVLSVPAAYASASHTEAAMDVLRDKEATFTRKRAAGASVYAALPIVAAKDLAMAPVFFVFHFVFFFVFVVVSFQVFVFVQVFGSGSFFGFGSVAISASIAGLLFVLGIFRLFRALARQPRIKAGKPAAEAIWCLGWYCCRCAVVYFQAGKNPLVSHQDSR